MKKIIADKYYTIAESLAILGYKTRKGVEYLVEKGHIKESETKILKMSPMGNKTIGISGAALKRILNTPRMKRYSFTRNLHADNE